MVDLHQIGDRIADELLDSDGTEDELFAVAIAGREQSMVLGVSEKEVSVHGLELRVGALLLPIDNRHEPVTTKHSFFFPPTAVLDLIMTLGRWVEHYADEHIESDEIYGADMQAMLDLESDEW